MQTKTKGRKPFEIPHGIKVNWAQTDKTIATQLGICQLTAWKLRRKLGVPPNKRGKRINVVKVLVNN